MGPPVVPLIILIIFRSANTSIFVSMAFIRHQGEKFLLVHAETVEQWVIGAGDLEGLVVDLLAFTSPTRFFTSAMRLTSGGAIGRRSQRLGLMSSRNSSMSSSASAMERRQASSEHSLPVSTMVKIHPCWMRMAYLERFFSTTPSAAHFARA